MRLRLRRLSLRHLHLLRRGSPFLLPHHLGPWFLLAHHLGPWLRLLDGSGRLSLNLRPILHRWFAPLWLWLGLHALLLLRVPDYWLLRPPYFGLTLLLLLLLLLT